MKKAILALLVGFTFSATALFAGNGDLIVNGTLGVGTSTPGQKVTAAGVIESTVGGFKFPDGTVQASASTSGKLSMGDTFGCTLSNNATDAFTSLDVSVGRRRDDTDTADMYLGGIMTKRLDLTWAAGNGNGGLQSGHARAASKWYNVYLIGGSSGTDVLFARQDTAFGSLPAGYSYKRRLGAFLTNTASNIVAFLQAGDYFWFAVLQAAVSVTNTTSWSTKTLPVPAGYLVQVIAEGAGALAWHPTGVNGGGGGLAGQGVLFTNANGQVDLKSTDSESTTTLRVLGWIDNRGKDY